MFGITPGIIHAYNMRNYDPLKGYQHKLVRPGAATKMVLPTENKKLSKINNNWRGFFTSPVYRAAYTEYGMKTHLGNDYVRLDPVVYRDWRSGMQVQWGQGVYQNESPFKGPMNLYSYAKANQTGDCPCK